MKYYVDVSQLPIAEGVAALPSFSVGSFSPERHDLNSLKAAVS
jgi:hypothetical protein